MVNQWFWDSTLALSIRVLESAVRPENAQAMWLSISTIFSMLVGSMRGLVILFSTARMTPSDVWMPMAVLPSLIASMAYSTWKSLPYTPGSDAAGYVQQLGRNVTTLKVGDRVFVSGNSSTSSNSGSYSQYVVSNSTYVFPLHPRLSFA